MWYGGSYKNPWDAPPRPDRMTVLGFVSGFHYNENYPKPEAVSNIRWAGMLNWLKKRKAESDGTIQGVISQELRIEQDYE